MACVANYYAHHSHNKGETSGAVYPWLSICMKIGT